MLGLVGGPALCLALLWGGWASPGWAQGAAEDAAVVVTEEERAEDVILAAMAAPWTGDLDGMVARGFVRIGVPHEPAFFVYDGPNQRGILVDYAAEFEKHLRATLGDAAASLTVALAPLPRDAMLDALVEGRVDLLAANLTITPQRADRVDFADPTLRHVREIVVAGPAAPTVASLDDLVEIGLRLRPSSSYFEHLATLNAQRAAAGLATIPVTEADENLEDFDLAELAEAGVIPVLILDSHKAEILGQIFPSLTLRHDLAIHEEGEIAWAMRKGSPELMAAVNGFMAIGRKGTELGNILYKRWFADPEHVLNAMAPDHEPKLRENLDFIRTHAQAYDFEPLLIAAQGFQESRLDQSAQSDAGAIGIMQLLPSTARDPAVGIPDIEIADRNVEAGVKYLRHLRDTYFDDPAIDPFNQALFAFAAYNAGPGNVRKARARAEAMGFSPNIWFGHVEVAAGRTISREPVVYVRNILKYYTTYKIYVAQKTPGGG